MRAFQSLFSPTAARHLVLLLLMGLLAAHGFAGAVRQVLGSTHRHDCGHSVGLVASSHGQAQQHQPAHGRAPGQGHEPGHGHGSFERHHHDIGDASVVAVDDGGAAGQGWAEGTVAAAAAGAELPSGMAHAPSLPAAAASACPWPMAQARTWQNAMARLPERPPRA